MEGGSLSPLPATSARPAVLLLGCSRFRFLYHSAVRERCDPDPYNWPWTLPSPLVGFGSAHGSLARSETAAGAICGLTNASFSAFGFFQHYGLAHGPKDVFSKGRSSHPHENWDGLQMGLLNSSSTIRTAGTSNLGKRDAAMPHELERILARVPPRRLILEAIQRFVYRAPPDAPIVVILSSATWDVARHHEQFAQVGLQEWTAEYRANLTEVVRSIQAAMDIPFVLTLATDYGTTRAWRVKIKPGLSEEENEAIFQCAANVMREVAATYELAVFDQAQILERMVRSPSAKGTESVGRQHSSSRTVANSTNAPPAVARDVAWAKVIRHGDGIHPTPRACEWLFEELLDFVDGQVKRNYHHWAEAGAEPFPMQIGRERPGRYVHAGVTRQ
mgnify:CR=1 FL=1